MHGEIKGDVHDTEHAFGAMTWRTTVVIRGIGGIDLLLV